MADSKIKYHMRVEVEHLVSKSIYSTRELKDVLERTNVFKEAENNKRVLSADEQNVRDPQDKGGSGKRR